MTAARPEPQSGQGGTPMTTSTILCRLYCISASAYDEVLLTN